MRNKVGNFCMLIGAALVIAALLLFCMNEREARRAESASLELLPDVVAQIEARSAQLAGETPEPEEAQQVRIDPYDEEMSVVRIGNYDYVGYVSIPKIGIELPVMSEWSYPQLRKSPCRYSGSTKTDDLVILAHNYARHFGKLSQLSPGDEVIFTDMNGVVSRYRVVEVDELSPYAVEQMTAGEYDLTLFTCTYGGRSRVTVRCDRAE